MDDIPANANVKIFEEEVRKNVLKHLEGDIEDVIAYLQNIKAEAQADGYTDIRLEYIYSEMEVQGQKNPGQKLTAIQVLGLRKETPSEYWNRVEEARKERDHEKKQRYDLYLKLKEEFENDNQD